MTMSPTAAGGSAGRETLLAMHRWRGRDEWTEADGPWPVRGSGAQFRSRSHAGDAPDVAPGIPGSARPLVTGGLAGDREAPGSARAVATGTMAGDREDPGSARTAHGDRELVPRQPDYPPSLPKARAPEDLDRYELRDRFRARAEAQRADAVAAGSSAKDSHRLWLDQKYAKRAAKRAARGAAPEAGGARQ